MIVVGNILTEGGKRSPQINQLETFTDYDEAFEFAVKLALEQQDSENERDVRQELQDDGDYADPNGMFSVFISDQRPAQDDSKDFEVTFGINGSITQVIRPVPGSGLTAEQITNGDAVTTVGKGGEVRSLPSLDVVGYVVAQEVGEDTEYDFEYEDDDFEDLE